MPRAVGIWLFPAMMAPLFGILSLAGGLDSRLRQSPDLRSWFSKLKVVLPAGFTAIEALILDAAMSPTRSFVATCSLWSRASSSSRSTAWFPSCVPGPGRFLWSQARIARFVPVVFVAAGWTMVGIGVMWTLRILIE